MLISPQPVSGLLPVVLIYVSGHPLFLLFYAWTYQVYADFLLAYPDIHTSVPAYQYTSMLICMSR